MRAACLVLICAVAASALLSGCGGGDRTPDLRGLPLISNLQIAGRARVCDKGANAYCALELVFVGRGYASARDMLRAERRLLKRHGWTKVNAPVGQELAADSPGDHLRVTYATASQELEAIDLGWVKRPRHITLTLSRQIFAHSSALAVLLQLGTA